MEKEINIAEILKDKPKGTKLYSLTYGDCFYQEYTGDFGIECNSQSGVLFNLEEHGRYCIEGECIIFPSKEMRDWNKFAWKKGDVLVSNDSDSHIIFKGFSRNDYTTFEGKHWISVSKKRHISCLGMQNTQDYHIEDDKDAAHNYINTIEKRLGGKLNRETLEVEANVNVGDVISDDVLYGICTKVGNSKVFCDFGCDSANYNAPITKLCLQKENINVVMPANKEEWYKEIEKIHHISIDRNTLEVRTEFKDGDIVVYGNSVAICRKIYKHTLYFYVSIDETFGLLSDDNRVSAEGYRYATEEEKQYLFDALAKEGKCWNAEKKVIEDIKKEYQFKPFEKVLTRDSKDSLWHIDLYEGMLKDGEYNYSCMAADWVYCIPYEGNEHLLGTTKDVEEDYEGNQE